MQKKPKRRFLDVQIVIATISMGVTLSLWNILASASRQTSNASIAEKFANEQIPKNEDQASSISPTPTAASRASGLTLIQLPPMKMLLGGKMPVARVVVNSTASISPVGSGSGAGSPTGSKPPPPVTKTSSSHP